MKEMKRILSLVLCFVMLVGMMPAIALNADAAERTLIDAAIFCSDVHNHPATVTEVFGGIRNMDSTFKPTTASFVGDTQCSASSVTAAAQEVYSDVECIYAFGNHDDEGNYGIADFTGLSYGDSTTNYYIYTISEKSMGSSNPDTDSFTGTVADLDKTKPLFIISHLPLHDRRGDSYGAPAWYAAISAAAEKMDIFFFWGHNHTNDDAVDQAAYYVPNDGSESMIIEFGDGESVYPNFTYANAGYIDPPNKPARNNVATAVYIYNDSVELVVCDADGLLTGSYAVNETVDRLFAPKTETTPVLNGIEAVSNKETYYVGEDLDITVYEVYSDGSRVLVEEGYTTQGFDNNTLGAQTVTVTYGDYSTTVSVTVVEQDAEPVLTGIQVTYTKETLLGENLALKVVANYDNGTTVELAEGDYTVEGYDPAATGVQGVVVTYKTASYGFNVINTNEVTVVADGMKTLTVTDVSETLTDALAEELEAGFVAYDIDPDAYNVTKNIAVVSMPAPEGANAVYYWNEETQALEPVTDVTFESGKVVFTTNHFSTYVVGTSTEIEVEDPKTATGSGETTTKEEKEVYVLVSAPTAGEQYIIVNRNTAGSGYALKENTTTGSSITVNAAGNGISAPWIETTDETIMWNTASGMTFQSENGNYYLRYNDGLTFSTRSSTNWTYSDSNTLYYSYSSSRNYYLYNSDGTWTASRYTSDEVYLYEKQTVEVETTTTASGTYSIAGTPAEVTKVVVNGTTVTLGSTLTFTPESGSATTTDTSATATYTVVSGGDPNGVISGISGNTVTFTGAYGTALVKVSYTTSFGEVTNYIEVIASEPTYVLDITSGGTVVTGTTLVIKGITNGMTLQLGTQIQFVDEDGAETVELPEGATIEWHIPAEYQNIAEVDHDTGLLTFKGVDGAFYVTATLTVGDKNYTAGVNISATKSQYSTPTDGTEDFPEFPNEGAIRFDKTATAVGNFSQTGIAQVELSMTGVPYTTGSEIDVVIMLDMTGSMSTTAMTAAEESAIAFAEQIVKNTDGSYNSNRVAVLAFNSGSASPYTLWSMGVVTEDTWDSFCTKVRTASDKKVSGGTPYDEALEKCQSVLQAAKTDGIGNDRQQFCVFVSDGGPTSFKYITNYDAVKAGTASSYTTSSASASGGSNQPDSNFATIATYTHEYYSTLMKDDGVTMYSVLTGLVAANYPNCTKILQNIASDSSKAYVVEDGDDTDSLTNAFSNIAMSILQAATDVTVEDQIADEYTMVFDIPDGTKDITGVTNDFYIEFGKYALDTNHERTTFTSVTKLYLQKDSSGNLSAKDATTPVFEQKAIGDKGTLYYWSTTAADGDAGISVEVDGTTYYFVSYGMKEAGYNMTSGAYAKGTVDATTNMSQNLVIATPYFVYNADTRMLYWTVDKLDTYEYALRYFLYLDNSATEIGTSKETDPGSYLTNDHAYITYTNFKGNDCRQEFPKPQLTWNGAQVSYVFYLVNAAGQPINKSGQVVDFANATFITDVHTESVVWNKEGDTSTGTGQLSANWLADELLPDEYEIYDEQARYVLNVYENADGTTIKNQFTISGDTAANISSSLNTRLKLATTESTVSISTTKVYNTKAGEKISAYGTYTSADSSMKDFDFANTTVAFAVVWQPRLVEDTVIVDFGLDVIINVVQNDILQNTVSGIGVGNSAYGEIAMNTGVSTTSKLGTADLTIYGNTISIENETSIRFHQGDMEFNVPVVFYYETPVEFWEGSDPTEGYMYSSVTVIPATTIYYEDSFIELTSFTKSGDQWLEDDGLDGRTSNRWSVEGEVNNSVQAQDRPGASQISYVIDADNIYGYDTAYSSMSTYSMGTSRKITVNSTQYGEATFTFYGTGFDLISLTSNKTGTITVLVQNAAGETVRNTLVDTYYGFNKVSYKVTYTFQNGEWVETGAEAGECEITNAPENPKENDTYTTCEQRWIAVNSGENDLFQVPVIEVAGLTYGKYTVTVSAVYSDFFNNTATAGSYDLYLDAVRIYDPTGNLNDTANDAYEKDHEAWPTYQELRDIIISEETYGTLTEGETTISGGVFIDGVGRNPSIKDYTSYGPNNELYLDVNQAVIFDLASDSNVDKVHIALKVVGGDGAVKIYGVDQNGNKKTVLDSAISSATDLYYDITSLKGMTVVIQNTGLEGDAIISITNIKTTHLAAPAAPVMMFSIRRASVETALATMVEEEEIETQPTEPETQPTEPETQPTEPETEPTEPETKPTLPETEPTEPETEPTEPSVEERVEEIVREVVKIIKGILGKLFG